MLAAMCSYVRLDAATTAKPLRWRLSIAKRCEGPKGRAATKKKARRTIDAPSNKTIGNCLLGFHCSQKRPAANRAVARFRVVAACQQGISSTAYPQTVVDVLGIVLPARFRCAIQRKEQR